MAFTMTPNEWATARDPGLMLRLLPEQAGARKLRLYACACCRRWWPYLPAAGRAAVVLSERFADGEGDAQDLIAASNSATAAAEGQPPVEACLLFACSEAARRDHLGEAAINVTDAAAEAAAYRVARLKPAGSRWVSAYTAEYRACAHALRDVLGNPFRPVPFSHSWLTAPVRDLARVVYDSRDFSLMPFLADALEEAGCDDGDVLSHCRDAAAAHVRGCWIVDRVLGTE